MLHIKRRRFSKWYFLQHIKVFFCHISNQEVQILHWFKPTLYSSTERGRVPVLVSPIMFALRITLLKLLNIFAQFHQKYHMTAQSVRGNEAEQSLSYVTADHAIIICHLRFL